MVVFLVPVGGKRYQLYVEISADDETDVAGEPQGSGWSARQLQKFRAMLAEAEKDRLRRESGEPETSSGVWRWILRKIAEFVAEQRLLWHLRHQTRATVRHPDDLTAAQALAEVRAEFARDVTRHIRWMVADFSIGALFLPIGILPGPNPAWYFGFRGLGHFFSWRGARKGLYAIEWSTEPSAPLSAIRATLSLHKGDRRARLQEISEALDLKHLAGFVERVSRRK